MSEQNVSVIVKRKSIQVVLDYCLDNRVETKMTPRDMPEEWELEFVVADIMKAINLGMFLKENKLELVGLLSTSTIKNSTAPAAVKVQKTAKKKPETGKAEETKESTLSTEGIFNTSTLHTENIFNTAPASATIDSDDELPL
jgi:hypothetical protein